MKKGKIIAIAATLLVFGAALSRAAENSSPSPYDEAWFAKRGVDGDTVIDAESPNWGPVKDWLERTRSDPRWQKEPWGGANLTYPAVRIFSKMDRGDPSRGPEWIPVIEEGLKNILSHQNPKTGMWGPTDISLQSQIGGAYKTIGRVGYNCGMHFPYMKELAQTLITYQKNHLWTKTWNDSAIMNAMHMMCWTYDMQDDHHVELLDAMESLCVDIQKNAPEIIASRKRRGRPTPDTIHDGAYGDAFCFAGKYLKREGRELSDFLRQHCEKRGYGVHMNLYHDKGDVSGRFPRTPKGTNYRIVLQPDGKTVKVVKIKK